MIIYQSTKDKFLNDVLSNKIQSIVHELYYEKTHKDVSEGEVRSWKESLRFMGAVLNDHDIPEKSGVSIEYMIPQSSKRIDFTITGKNEQNENCAVIIELKQWQTSKLTSKDGVISTTFHYGDSDTTHPAYQAWSYAALLEGFNEAVYNGGIKLRPCAYLHNYTADGIVNNDFYKEYIEKAPLFFSGEREKLKLQEFIKRFVKYGDNSETMFVIDSSNIRPSKKIADSLASMLHGNKEFIMIDDQKVVYENIIATAKKSTSDNKNIIIVEGGPGTGKTVVAINVLSELTKMGLLAQYVSKNAAPRTVYESKLTGVFRKTEISNFFTGSGSFLDTENGIFDMLIVDEAHRLNEKSGLYRNLGENQIKELIQSSKSTVFFIDEDQRVTWDDIGTKEEIKNWAKRFNANIQEFKLESQFRCNGSEGYLGWLDQILQIRETANLDIKDLNYEFKVMDSPNELRDAIFHKNNKNQARIVAGYCWNWVSKKNQYLNDINIDEFNFHARWNLASDGNLWIINPDSVNEIGCIHTSQGLEVDHIGVIIGNDFIVREGNVITIPNARAKTDKSLNGYRKMLAINEQEATRRADLIIKNTYRTLMTRGMKSCYVYCTDAETREYFKSSSELKV